MSLNTAGYKLLSHALTAIGPENIYKKLRAMVVPLSVKPLSLAYAFWEAGKFVAVW